MVCSRYETGILNMLDPRCVSQSIDEAQSSFLLRSWPPWLWFGGL